MERGLGKNQRESRKISTLTFHLCVTAYRGPTIQPLCRAYKMENDKSLKDAFLKDLELQWKDHFHMRDQTWKTLTNAVLLFLGVVGLEIKGIENIVMIPAYLVVILTAFFGWSVASHHRLRQKQKFAMITKYEELLGIYQIKKAILEEGETKANITSKFFTGGFTRIMHIGIGTVAVFLLVRRLVLLA
jgi:hypothetical protein